MSEWLPSLNALRAFEVVSRHLNYHLAAQELNVTPAAVKQLVSKLETSVGAKLLERSGQGLRLTTTGLAGLEELAEAMAKMSLSVKKMRAGDRLRQLIVTVESSFATAWLVPRLEAFRSRYPRINVLIDSSQHIVDLSRNEVDVAIRYGVTPSTGEISHRLFDDQIFPACSPAFIRDHPGLKSPHDLASIPLIHWDISQLEWAHETRRWFTWERWLERVDAGGVECSHGIRFNDYGLAVQAAIAGQGVILASSPILNDTIESGLLMQPLAQTVSTDIGYDVVVNAEAASRPDVQAFIDWIDTTASSM